jgi:hypothetical protein
MKQLTICFKSKANLEIIAYTKQFVVLIKRIPSRVHHQFFQVDRSLLNFEGIRIREEGKGREKLQIILNIRQL